MQIEAIIKNALDWQGESSKNSSFRGLIRWWVVRLCSPPDMYSRYQAVLGLLKKEVDSESRLLEVGSGATGMTRYWRRHIHGVDVQFDGPELGYLKKIRLSGDKLPFADREFDWVVSCDVWEHLDIDLRRRVIHQMLRVAKDGVISVAPSGDMSVEKEKRLAKWLLRRGIEIPEWMLEHRKFGLPDRMETAQIIREEAEKLGREVEVRTRMVTNNRLWFFTWKVHTLAEQSFAYRLLTVLLIPLSFPLFSWVWRLGDGYRCCWEARLSAPDSSQT